MADGKYYEGDFYDDKKQGLGVYNWPDRRQYDGQWVDGK